MDNVCQHFITLTRIKGFFPSLNGISWIPVCAHCLLSCLWELLNLALFPLPPHNRTFIHTDTIPPELSFLQAEWSWPFQPLIIWKLLQLLDQFSGSSLCVLQYIFVLHLGAQNCWTYRDKCISPGMSSGVGSPPSTPDSLPNASQNSAGRLCHRVTLLVHIELAVYKDPVYKEAAKAVPRQRNILFIICS